MARIKPQEDNTLPLVSFDWIVFSAAVIGVIIVTLASFQAGENGLAAQLSHSLTAGS
jgi:hypothetical protein